MGCTSFWSMLVILIYWVKHIYHNQEHSPLLNSSKEVGKDEKGKVPVVTMKTYMGSRDIAPLILNLTTIWK
jgi:hypothetical protein